MATHFRIKAVNENRLTIDVATTSGYASVDIKTTHEGVSVMLGDELETWGTWAELSPNDPDE